MTASRDRGLRILGKRIAASSVSQDNLGGWRPTRPQRIAPGRHVVAVAPLVLLADLEQRAAREFEEDRR